jgi:hypothetical protein
VTSRVRARTARNADLDGPNTVDSDFSARFLSARLGFRHYGGARRGIAGNTRQLVGIVNGQQITGTTSGWIAQTSGVRLTGAIFF